MDGDTEGQTLCAEYGTPFPSHTYLAPPIEFLKAKDKTQKHLWRSSCSFDLVSHFVEQYPDLKPNYQAIYTNNFRISRVFIYFLLDDVNKFLEIKFGSNYTPTTYKSFSFSTYQMYKNILLRFISSRYYLSASYYSRFNYPKVNIPQSNPTLVKLEKEVKKLIKFWLMLNSMMLLLFNYYIHFSWMLKHYVWLNLLM